MSFQDQKQQMQIHLLALALASVLLGACNRPTEGSGAAAQTEGRYADFAGFYERFHQDSLYQLEHVQFPLEGLPSDADSLTLARNDFRWTKENWRMHRRFDFANSDFEQKLLPVTDDLIVEQIIHRSGNYAMQRRFTRWGGEWYLTYYIGLNQFDPGAGVHIEGGF